MRYDVYHDESKEEGYWHGILLVPQDTRERFLSQLKQIRANTHYGGVVRLKGLDKTSGKRYRCIRAWMHFGVASLIQNLKGERYPFYTGKDLWHPGFGLLEQVIGARFILFKVREDHRSLEGYPDYGAKVETTFRIGFKGGLHLFAAETRQLTITSFHFDGHEHYARKVDKNRIVGRLGPLREGVHVLQDARIDDRSGEHTKSASQPFDDCQFLQLTDILVGGFRTTLGHRSSKAQEDVAAPLRELAEKWKGGYARMRNSRWFKGLCISECFLEDGEWRFGDIRPSLPDIQLGLPGIPRSPSQGNTGTRESDKLPKGSQPRNS